MPKQQIKKYEKPVNVRFENKEWENIRAVAKSENETVSSLIRNIVKEYLK